MAWSWISWTSHLESSYMPLRFNLAGWILVLVVVLPVPIHFIVNCVCFYRKRVSLVRVEAPGLVNSLSSVAEGERDLPIPR